MPKEVCDGLTCKEMGLWRRYAPKEADQGDEHDYDIQP